MDTDSWLGRKHLLPSIPRGAAAFQGLHWQEARVKNQSQKSSPGTLMRDMGVLTARLKAHSLNDNILSGSLK